MAKTRKQIIQDLKMIDVVVEILDARIPVSSRNPDIEKYTKEVIKVIVLNKSDLADAEQTKRWIKHFESKGTTAVIVDSASGKGINDVIKSIKNVSREKMKKFINKGRVGRAIKVMVVGIPNVGKSSFINKITKKSSAKVGNKPGVTRDKQWVRVDSEIELMDTPGILWPKFESQIVAQNLAFTGTIKDDILPKTDIAFELLKFLVKNYKKNLMDRYKLDQNIVDEIINNLDIEENDRILKIIDMIALKRGAILSGGRIDYEKVSNILLEEFRSGKIGKITIEKVGGNNID